MEQVNVKAMEVLLHPINWCYRFPIGQIKIHNRDSLFEACVVVSNMILDRQCKDAGEGKCEGEGKCKDEGRSLPPVAHAILRMAAPAIFDCVKDERKLSLEPTAQGHILSLARKATNCLPVDDEDRICLSSSLNKMAENVCREMKRSHTPQMELQILGEALVTISERGLAINFYRLGTTCFDMTYTRRMSKAHGGEEGGRRTDGKRWRSRRAEGKTRAKCQDCMRGYWQKQKEHHDLPFLSSSLSSLVDPNDQAELPLHLLMSLRKQLDNFEPEDAGAEDLAVSVYTPLPHEYGRLHRSLNELDEEDID